MGLRRYLQNPHYTESAVVIGQKAIGREEKTNEIPIFQEILETLDVQGKTITADAMHCQTKTCEKIIKQEGNYCFELKENQKNFFNSVAKHFTAEHDFDVFTTTEKHNERFEERTCLKMRNIDCLDERHEWAGIRSIFAVKHATKHKTSTETNYYISSLDETPKKLLKIVREHWKIESMHWLLDVVFSEDKCRLKNDEGQKTLNSFRKLGLMLHKKHIAAQLKNAQLKGACSIACSLILTSSICLKFYETDAP